MKAAGCLEQLSEDCLLEQPPDCCPAQNLEAAVGDAMPCRLKLAKIMQKLQIRVTFFATVTSSTWPHTSSI